MGNRRSSTRTVYQTRTVYHSNHTHQQTMKNKEMQRQREERAYNERLEAQRQAHERARERERAAASERASRLAQAARDAERRAQLEQQKQRDAQQQYLKQLENREKEKQRQHLEAENSRKRAHQKEIEQLELQKKQKQKEIEAQEQKHQEDLKKMWIDAKEEDRANKEKQRNDAIQRIQGTIKGLSDDITAAKADLTEVTEERKEIMEKLKIQDKNIDDFDMEYELKEERKEMEDAHAEWKRSDDEILAAIAATGQDEDNVGRFLRLTHNLIGQTTATQANANKLDAELKTFQVMIERECQDKLMVESYFKEKNLTRFVPILAKQGFKECQNMICENEDEFKEDIMGYLEEEVNKEIDEWKKRHPNEQNPLEAFLEHYRLQKFKKGLAEGGLEDFADIQDMEEEDTEEMISAAGIKGLNKKKFKRAIKDVQSGKYKSPEPEPENESALAIAAQDEGKDVEDTGDETGKDSAAKPDVKKAEKAKVKDEKPKEISLVEKREIKKICLQSSDEEVGWKHLEIEKAYLTKEGLKEITPILGGFFERMHGAVKQAQKLLDLPQNKEDGLNNKQAEAVQILMNNVKSPPKAAIKSPRAAKDDSAPDIDPEDMKDSITEGKDNDDEDEEELEDEPKNLPDYEQRKAWKVASEVQVYSKSADKWYNGKIVDITTDKEGEWLSIEYATDKDKKEKQVDRYGKDIRDPIMTECRAITSAIMVDINIVSIMRDEFQVSETTKRALPVATGVEESVRAILICQSQIRQSVRLAGQLLNLKPSNFTETSKALWAAVDDGIMHILKSALEMSKISTEYFGYFLRFNQSFQRYISMNEKNKDVTLFTSLEHIKQDITDFSDFKKEFNKRLAELSNEATKVIRNCVQKHIGAEQFERARICREQSKFKYLDKKDAYDKKSLKIAEAFETLCVERATERAKEAKLKYRQDTLEKAITRNEGYIAGYREKESELNALNFGAGFEDNK